MQIFVTIGQKEQKNCFLNFAGGGGGNRAKKCYRIITESVISPIYQFFWVGGGLFTQLED